MKIHTSNFHFTLGKVNSETLNTVHNLSGTCLKYLSYANYCNTGYTLLLVYAYLDN